MRGYCRGMWPAAAEMGIVGGVTRAGRGWLVAGRREEKERKRGWHWVLGEGKGREKEVEGGSGWQWSAGVVPVCQVQAGTRGQASGVTQLG